MCVCVWSVVQSCPTLCDVVDCSPPFSSIHELSKQEYWSGLPFLPPRDLPDPGLEPRILHCRWILYYWAMWETLYYTYISLQVSYMMCCLLWRSILHISLIDTQICLEFLGWVHLCAVMTTIFFSVLYIIFHVLGALVILFSFFYISS